MAGILEQVNARKLELANMRESNPEQYAKEISTLRGSLSLIAKHVEIQKDVAVGQQEVKEDKASEDRSESREKSSLDELSAIHSIFKNSPPATVASIDEVVKELRKGFASLRQAIASNGPSLLDDAADMIGGRGGKGKPGIFKRGVGAIKRGGSRVLGSIGGFGTRALEAGGELLSKGKGLLGGTGEALTGVGSRVAGWVSKGAEGVSRLGSNAASIASKLGPKALGLGSKVLGAVALPLSAISTVSDVSDAQKEAEAQGRNRTGAGASTAVSQAATLGLGSLAGIKSTGDLVDPLGFGYGKSVDKGFDYAGRGVEAVMNTSGLGDIVGRAVAIAAAPFSDSARDALASEFRNDIVPTFEKSMGRLDATWRENVDKLGDYTDALKAGASGMWSAVKTASSTIGQGLSSATDQVAAGWKKGGFRGAWDALTGAGSTALGAGRRAMGQISQGAVDAYTGLGSVSARLESGGRGVASISSGKGDAGGVSYGTYQLATNNGSMQNFLMSKEGRAFADQLGGAAPGTMAFNKAYSALATGDKSKDFAQAQQDYMKRTHYDVAANKLKDSTGIDVGARGKALQEAVFSTSVQYGANSSVLGKALGGLGKDATDEQMINALQNYKAANVATNFRSSSPEVQASVASRIENERQTLLALDKRTDLAPPTGATSAGAPSPTASKAAGVKATATGSSKVGNTAIAAATPIDARATPAVAPVKTTPEVKPVMVTNQPKPKQEKTTVAQAPVTRTVSNAPSLDDVPAFFPDPSLFNVLSGTV